jgi:hypothetical protein
MKRHWRLALVIAVAGAFAPGAGASSASAISVTDFLVSVKSIAPGSNPSVTFDGAGGSTSESGSSSGRPRPDQHHTAGSQRAFGDAATSTTFDPFAGGSAVIDGNVFGGGAVARASAYASSLVPLSFGEGSIGLVNDVAAAAFTLAPGTLMTITARVTATARTTGDSASEFAESGLLMAIGDETGLGPQRDYIAFNVYAPGFVGPYTDNEARVLTLVYANETDAAISGLFSGYIASYASSGDPPPASDVPEPPPASLMLAALLAAGVAVRGRRHARAARQ